MWFPYGYVIFIPLEKLLHSFHLLIFDPLSQAFPSVWSGDSLNMTSIAYSYTLLALTSSYSSSLGMGRIWDGGNSNIIFFIKQLVVVIWEFNNVSFHFGR